MTERLTNLQAIVKGAMQATAFVTGLKFLGLAPDLVSAAVAYVCISIFVRLETKTGFHD